MYTDSFLLDARTLNRSLELDVMQLCVIWVRLGQVVHIHDIRK